MTASNDAPPATLGILLLYYPPYARLAIDTFVALMRRVDRNARCLLVFNNPMLLESGIGEPLPCVAGDNTLHEFSGWDAGIAHARNVGLMPSRGTVVIANDTFCHHNRFGPLSRWAFASSLRGMVDRPGNAVMCGDVQRGLSTFTVSGLPCSRWVSSYLFGIDAELLERVTSVAPPIELVTGVHAAVDPESMIDAGIVSPTLRQHIMRWLFPEPGRDGWYGGGQLDANSASRYSAKARAILAEKSLSARVMAANGQIRDVFEPTPLKQLRKFEHRPTPGAKAKART